MSKYPLRHLSIRVPWHDSGWAGVVCEAPHLNGACAKLKQIAKAKNDESERSIAGNSLEVLSREQWPVCVAERAAFMAPFEMDHLKRHALGHLDYYNHFNPTTQRYPAFSAGVIPFLWMLRKNLEEYGERLDLDVDPLREPGKSELGYKSSWVNEAQNQSALLESFAGHLRRDESLCLFYAKHVPFIEGTGRILLGAGRVKDIGKLIEYDREGDGPRGMVWERPIQHSIRPNGRDGFLMPYHEVLRLTEEDSTIDLDRYTAQANHEHWNEFSYCSELVTHDGAISSFLSLESTLTRIENELGIATDWQRQWLHDELTRLWRVRGPFPGLGSILSAFGLSRGLFVAHALQQRAGENADPWSQVDLAFAEPASVLPLELTRDLTELAPTWRGLSDTRRNVLRLLSRFEIDTKQARYLYDEASRNKQGWGMSDVELLQNPYRIYEVSRHDPESVHLLTVDRGVFPEDSVRLLHPLEAPSGLNSGVDARRVRAFSIKVLENASILGHTLEFASNLAEAISEDSVRPACKVTTDILSASQPILVPEIASVETDGKLVLQLERYQKIRNLIRKQVLGRVEGQRHSFALDWRKLLDEKFSETADSEEQHAREEKAKALAELAESRFSVLAGPAGSGKTSILGILCDQDEIKSDGILLLAPTGKARVRLQELAGDSESRAQTIAQFLHQNGRYDVRSDRYMLSDRPKASGFGTVVVDEASMLTEDMLGALLDALQGVKRFILVGDPAQLPPIGAGRPFVDIIAKLRPTDYESIFPRVSKGYAELTIERRQAGVDRPDLRLARWFSATPPSAGEDDIFTYGDHAHPTLRFVAWNKIEDFQERLLEVLTSELNLQDVSDERGFNRELGATAKGEYDYFNRTRNGNIGAVGKVEAWQILSPLRGMPFGVSDINRKVHESFRTNFIKLASSERYRKIPKPLGAERIVYGDKVINLSNHRRDGKRVYPPEEALGYLANGEIGVVVGQWRYNNRPPSILKVEFSSQRGFTYDFYRTDFQEEGDVALELAYALTVHKAQGSQFNLVILVIPEEHPILSREMIYTALTRHQSRVVVMHQGPRSLLKDFTAPYRSETARRQTNLLADCRMLEIPQTRASVFMQDGLLHRTSMGLAVRSKSELLIAEALQTAGVTFQYEKPLTLGGQTRYPDFTIEDEISGRTVYWEHLGMLDREDYRASWEQKFAWYQKNGVKPFKTVGSETPFLVTTEDSRKNGLDMAKVKKLIEEVFGG